jgi:hypothetical protein
MDELVQMLTDAAELESEGEPQDVFTAHELAKKTGWAYGKTLTHLSNLMANGQLDRVPVRRENLAGHMSSVTAYRLRK